jgi:hypothetical protein
MKIRIKANTLRVRFSQLEMDQFGETGLVSDQIDFPGGESLRSEIEVSETADRLGISFEDSVIRISVPVRQAREWIDTGQVGISEKIDVDGQRQIELLLEKDFRCLVPREGENEADLFPNPNQKQRM